MIIVKTIIFLFLLYGGIGHSLVEPVFATNAEDSSINELGWKFEYDDSDRITKLTDPAGRATNMQYSFDDAKRLRKLSRISDDESGVHFEFDEYGRRSTMTDSMGTVSYDYGGLGRLTRVQRKRVWLPKTSYVLTSLTFWRSPGRSSRQLVIPFTKECL